MFGGIKVNSNWIKGYNEELILLFGYLYTLSFIRISRLNWIGPINNMDIRRKVSQVFKNNLQGSPLIGRPKSRRWNCVQTDVNRCKITN